MSAVLYLKQREAAYILSDAASYTPDGVLMSVNAGKCIAMPTLSAAVCCTGPTSFVAWLAMTMPDRFESFDDVLEHGETVFPEMFEEFAAGTEKEQVVATINLIGWSERRSEPVAGNMNVWQDGERIQQIIANGPADQNVLRNRFAFSEMGGTPLPGADLKWAGHLSLPNDRNKVRPEIDLLHLMEIQRHERIEGRFWVGGKAVLTTVDRKGVSQRILHHWIEDQVGSFIEPPAIDWKKWRAEREGKSLAAVDFTGLSRLQRERMEKKARKGTLK